MSLPNKAASSVIDKKLSPTGKAKTLNPDAAEFVPFALRSPSGTTNAPNTSSNFNNFGPSTPGKTVILNRSESSVSNNSDDEAHQFWQHQLPDDITPDFNITGEEESQEVNNISFSNLSISDINASLGNFQEIAAKPWDNHDNQLLNHGNQLLNPGQGYLDEMLNDKIEGTEVNPLGFLASQFPGFAAESLAEVYYANGCDLNLTIEMLTQLELQVDNGSNQNLNSKAVSAPNLSSLDFPTLSPKESQNNISKYPEQHQNYINPYRSLEKDLLMFESSSTAPSLGAPDFASAVRKIVSQDSSIWKYDRNISQNPAIGSSRSNHVLASGYNGGRGRGGLVNRSSSRSAPVWLETGEPVANMYSEMRGEARDHARLCNAYFEQARQAYLVGYKALAKELSVKGQLHNMQMKAAHGKAQESIYHQRNPVSPEMHGNERGKERIIDLHGLHVSEAIHILKRELTILRNIARSADQRVQVYICVGTGHHTRGTRTPARLPVAVQRYLLEEEGLDYSEPQPGLLRVVL